MSARHRILTAIAATAVGLATVGCQQSTATATGPSPIRLSNNSDGLVRKEMAYPTGDPATSALLVEKTFPGEVIAGRRFSYDIKVTNISKLKLQGIRVIETPSKTMAVADASQLLDPTAEDGSMTWKLGALGPQESQTLRVNATVAGAGELGSCTLVSYDSSLCLTTNAVSPSLKLTVAAPSDTLVCEPIPLTITVTNGGSGLTRNITVADDLPAGITTLDGKTSFAFDAGTLAGGETKVLKLNVKAAKTGEYSFKALAKADNDMSALAAPINTAVRQPVLLVERGGTERQYVGRPITYEIAVTNTGDAIARNVVLTETLSQIAKLNSASDEGVATQDGKVTWNLGDLEPKSSRKVTLNLVGTAKGDLINTALATARCAEEASAPSRTNLTGAPGIRFEVLDTIDPVVVGDDTTYDIVVTNQGSATATNVKIQAILEDTMRFVSATGETEGKADGKTVTFATLPALEPQTQAVWRVTIKAGKSADARFKATMTSDQLGKRPVEKTEATNFYE
jgi:uncharacterized repeat protein (TIGR01451 family)